jgi:hypothetical protein
MSMGSKRLVILLIAAGCDALRKTSSIGDVHFRTILGASRSAPFSPAQALVLRGGFSTVHAVPARTSVLIASGAPAEDVVPGRSVVFASSVSFIIASLLLMAEFIAIYCGFFSIVNYLGAASCVGWVVGFVLLINWIVFSTFPVWGFDKRALIGATIKLIAACFFNIQPWSWIVAPGYGVPGIGVPWSNFVGAWMFHTGNTIDAVGMASMYDKSSPFSLANWPVLGMWVLTAASTFLSIAGTVDFFKAPARLLQYTIPSQIFGAFLLLVGSVMYTYWSCSFGKPAA